MRSLLRLSSAHAWQRRVGGRVLIVLGLVGTLVAGGWMIHRGNDDAGTAAAPQRPAVPPVLLASTPLEAQAPAPNAAGSKLESWTGTVAANTGIPERALAGYANAELTMREQRPDCHLSWITLAGIGKAASDHGRTDGNRLRPNGDMRSAIDTVPMAVPGGQRRETPEASGPMQLAPALWDRWQRDADKAGEPDVQNIDDAALATAGALCAGGTDTADGAQWWNAIGDYRDSELFRQRVLANANLYAVIAGADDRPSEQAVRAVRFAIGQLGLPYVWGGNGPQQGGRGFDCSGLTTEAFARAGIDLPRTAHWQFGAVPRVPPHDQPKLGDLVFYGNPNTKIHHVGLYIGNGLMINAPTFGQAVQIHNYRTQGDDYAGAGRPAV